MATATGRIEFVLDSSVALKWVLKEEDSSLAMRLRSQGLAAPDLIYLECANVLWTKARAGRVTTDEAERDFRTLQAAPLRIVPTGELLDSAFRLSLRLNHPTYDCLYAALAQRLRVPLVTADRRLVMMLRQHEDAPCDARSLEEFA